MCKKRQKHPFFHTFIKVWIWPGLPPSPRVEKIHIFYFFLKASITSIKLYFTDLPDTSAFTVRFESKRAS